MAHKDNDVPLLPQVRTFTIERQDDESGVSGTGVVLEGVVFSTGYTVAHWLKPSPRGSLSVWDSFDQFMRIHVLSHPINDTIIRWGDGDVWGKDDYPPHPGPFDVLHREEED